MSIFDGVLADFNTSFINRCVGITGRDLFPSRPFDIHIWDYPTYYGYSHKEISSVWDSIKADPHFWERIPTYSDTHQAVIEINSLIVAGHDIYFITDRIGIRAKQQTEKWLRRMGVDAPTVLLSGEKGLCAKALKLDRYIDDKVENILGIERSCQTFLLDRPWNQLFDSTKRLSAKRVFSLHEMFNN